jgi:hypothetical protein
MKFVLSFYLVFSLGGGYSLFLSKRGSSCLLASFRKRERDPPPRLPLEHTLRWTNTRLIVFLSFSLINRVFFVQRCVPRGSPSLYLSYLSVSLWNRFSSRSNTLGLSFFSLGRVFCRRPREESILNKDSRPLLQALFYIYSLSFGLGEVG